MTSDVCKHCTEAACLDVCPTGALFRTEFGTVVVQEDVCNGCGYCVAGLPVRRDRPARGRRPRLEVHALLRPPAGRPGAGLRAGLPDRLDPVRRARRLRAPGRATGSSSCTSAGSASARLYGADDDDGVGGVGAFFLLLDEPEVYGLPPDPVVPTRHLPEACAAAAAASAALLVGVAAALHRQERAMRMLGRPAAATSGEAAHGERDRGRTAASEPVPAIAQATARRVGPRPAPRRRAAGWSRRRKPRSYYDQPVVKRAGLDLGDPLLLLRRRHGRRARRCSPGRRRSIGNERLAKRAWGVALARGRRQPGAADLRPRPPGAVPEHAARLQGDLADERRLLDPRRQRNADRAGRRRRAARAPRLFGEPGGSRRRSPRSPACRSPPTPPSWSPTPRSRPGARRAVASLPLRRRLGRQRRGCRGDPHPGLPRRPCPPPGDRRWDRGAGGGEADGAEAWQPAEPYESGTPGRLGEGREGDDRGRGSVDGDRPPAPRRGPDRRRAAARRSGLRALGRLQGGLRLGGRPRLHGRTTARPPRALQPEAVARSTVGVVCSSTVRGGRRARPVS